MKRFAAAGMTVVLAVFFGSAYASSEKAKTEPAKPIPSPQESTSTGAMSLSGKVTETMDAGGYTYLCLQKKGKKIWAAIPQSQVKAGQYVELQPGAEMANFTSKSLNRTFKIIIFSPGLIAKGGKAAAGEEMHGGSKAAAVKSTEKISVEKANGADAYTVGEIFTQSAKLDKKTAVIKARVMKVSPGIMGKNWVHLQDGTGDPATGSNDLVATSQDLPSVGDVVTMKGTIFKDKDFGAGYRYKVIMEQASLQH